MKKLLTLATLLLITSTSYAAVAFLKGEYVSGMNKVCIYDHLGSDYSMTVGRTQLCPLSTNVN